MESILFNYFQLLPEDIIYLISSNIRYRNNISIKGKENEIDVFWIFELSDMKFDEFKFLFYKYGIIERNMTSQLLDTILEFVDNLKLMRYFHQTLKISIHNEVYTDLRLAIYLQFQKYISKMLSNINMLYGYVNITMAMLSGSNQKLVSGDHIMEILIKLPNNNLLTNLIISKFL